MAIGVIDYGVSNLDSVCRAVVECGAEPRVLDSPEQLATVSAFILPGVGSFETGMANLRERGLASPLSDEVNNNSIPILGICLGMQLFAESGTEGRSEGTPGLGWIRGQVRRLEGPERIPHVGWNEVYPQHDNPSSDDLFRGLGPGRDFYFVHSYQLVPTDDAARAASTPYAGGFCSAVAIGNIWGVQFHPEKSQKTGFQIVSNFIEAAC